MNRIKAPIKPGDAGDPVSDLRAALLSLLRAGAVKAFEFPNQPTADELAALAPKVHSEQAGGKAYGGDTLQLVLYIQIQHGLGDVQEGTVDEATAALLNQLLEKYGAPLDDDAHLVEGRVASTEGQPLVGLRVVAYELDLFKAQLLGESVTGDDGRYRIAYTPQPTLAGEGLPHVAPDIQVQVLGSSADPLATSPVHFNVGPVATIDFVVPTAEQGPIEFDEVTRRVTPMLGDHAATEITVQQIEFIVGDTGLAVDAIQAWVTGARLQADALALIGFPGIPEFRDALQKQGWPFGHAWQRMSGIGTLAGLLASGRQMWEAALDGGAARRWIETPDEAQRKTLLAALAHLQQLATADPQHSTDPMVPRIAAYLGGVPPTMAVDALRLFRDQGEIGLEKILDLGGGDPTFHEPLARLVRAIRVHDLAEGHQPLIEPLMARLGDEATGLGGLMPLQLVDWQALTHEALAGSPEAGGLAYRMLAAVEQQAPARALLTRLEQGAIVPQSDNGGELLGVVAGNQAAVELVMKGGLEQDEVRGFVTEFPGHARYVSDLGVYNKIGIDLAHGSRLMDTGFSMSGWLTNHGKGKPLGPLQPEGPMGQSLPPEILKIMDGLAARFKGDVDKLFGFERGQLRPQRERIQDDKEPDVGPPSSPPVEGISSPTVRGMFGDLDTCVCRPCESVLGPGAYLVDLLRALQLEVSMQPAGNGLDLLLGRRPDVLDLDLGCENAELLVPHIDLALEQLEWLASKPDLFFVTAQRPVTDWLGPPLDPALRALLQETTEHAIDTALTTQPKLGLWLVQEGSGRRSWWIAPEDASANGCRGWRVVGMAIRRSAALSDPGLAPAERNPKAYEALVGPAAVYPWALPFDAAEADRRALFDAMQVDPLQLGPWLPAYDAAQRLDRDTLRLSAAEEALLVNARSGDALWQAWGFANDSPLAAIDDPASGATLANSRPSDLLTYASFLLARSGLTLEELELALATDFVGRYTLSNREQCQTSLMRAQRGTSPNQQFIDATGLDRMHRLTRLWRKLPAWPLPTLDSALRSTKSSPGAPAALGGEQLRLLAAMERARRALGIEPDQLLALRLPLADVDRPGASGTISVFSAAFLSRHVPADARDAFSAALGVQATPPAWAAWQAQAAAALGMPAAQAVLPAATFPTAALTANTLSWLYRHRVLAVALGQSIGELLLLLQWRGWGASGLGTAGDPLVASPSLTERAADFDRLAQLRSHASTLADLDLTLPVLAASQIEPLQQRGSTTPQPPGARTTEALHGDLLALRSKLAAVVDPPASPKPSTARDMLASELLALSWAPALVEQLGIELTLPPVTGLSSEIEKALLEQLTALLDPQPMLTAEELKALLRLEPSADARFVFLLDRLTERRGLRELEVAGRLSPHLGGTDARVLLAALRSADARQRKEAAARLATGNMQQPALAQPQPLLEPHEAERLANAETLDSWRSRLDLIDARLASREREKVLLNEITTWALRHGVEWPATAAEGFLTDRLTLRGAPVAGLARDALLDPGFHQSHGAAAPATVLAWATQLDGVLALRAHSPVAAALQDLPGLDWRGLLDAADAAAREPLAQLLWLADAKRLGMPTLSMLFEPAATKERMLAGLAKRLGLATGVVEALAVRAVVLTGTQTLQPSHLRNPAALWRLYQLAETARRLQATGPQLDALLGTTPQASLDTARALVAGLTGARDWPRQLRRLNDASRTRSRDALVAHLVHQLNLRDADALFERVLIDPLVQACMDTARLKQATAATQLLVQRVLEGLEPGAQASDKLRQQWNWMRAYRLWEANRKVFLYPENWLLPELRDDKSPEFRALESSISEDELTPTRANQAFGRFLEELNWTAQTQVVGMFEQTDALPNAAGQRPRERSLLVVGRSPSPPHTYHWRQCRDFGKRSMEWTSWERIESDIPGHHVVPFMALGSLYLAWPLVRDPEGADPSQANKWRLDLAWTQFEGTGWRKVSVTGGDVPLVDRVPLEDQRSALAFRAAVPPSGPMPSVHAYLKAAAPGTAGRVPDEPPDSRSALRVPSRLLQPDGIAELARLLAAVFDSLPEHDRDVVELYLHWSHSNRTLGYISRLELVGISPVLQPWIATDVFSSGKFMAFHKEVRDHATEKHVRDDVLNRRYDPLFLTNFLQLYRTHMYLPGSSYTSGSWTPNAYGQLIEHVLAHCSGLELIYQVWMRFPNGLLTLQLDPGKTFELSHPALAASSLLGPGVPTVLQIKPGSIAAGDAALVMRTSARQFPEVKRPVPEVRRGELLRKTLHFEIDGRSDAGGVQGPPADRQFRQLIRYTLGPTGVMDAQDGDLTLLETLDSNSAVWMGGLREKNEEITNNAVTSVTPRFPLTLRRTWRPLLSLFSQSDAANRYEVIPAAVNGGTSIAQTGVWHFAEGQGRCFIDANSENEDDAAAAKTVVYPTAWLGGARLLQGWYTTATLPSWSDQSDDFGAESLPPIGGSALTSILQTSIDHVKQGRWTFDNRMPNAGNWWEICLHAPLAIADQLTRQQRFQEADRWLRMVYDPLTSSAADPQAFLRFRLFRTLPRAVGVASDLKALAMHAASNSTASPSVARVQQAIDRWRSQPFRPYVIARQRHVAFLWRTLFAYLENLLAWADSLYRRETRDSIQEAVLKYVQVARLLGLRPRRARAVAVQPAASFIDYLGQWDEFANHWLREVTIERKTPVAVAVDAPDDYAPVEGLLFFCLPPNERLIGYWDIVEQRLRNIRHCRTIDGVERSLPIEAPEINLDELIRSVAAGGTPENFLAGSFAQPWPYRYPTLLAQAKELVGDVKALGAQLLAALEKRDSEVLSQLRSTHELAMLARVTEVRTLQIDEAERQVQSLRTSREAIAARYEQLQRQLGNEGVQAPQIHQSAGTESPLGRLSSGNAHAPSNLGLITEEALQLEQLHYANWWIDADSVARLVAWGFNATSAAAGFASVFEPSTPPGGSTPSEKAAKALGALGSAASSTADGFRAIAQIHQIQASRLGQSASNIRRRDEWAFQSNQALRELATIDNQIAAAEAREAVVRNELANHELQREQSAATDAYLREKFTGTALYQWQSGQLLTLYRATYDLALAISRRALQAAQRELGESLPPIRGRWSAAHSGLLAGEFLQRELKALELSMLERNSREEEPIRHVSLRRLDPRALVELIAEGSCEFEVPEWLFDLDAPGHWLRRIKTVSVSVPCVTGPQTSINARLTLLRSDTRVSPLPGANYLRQPEGDERFETRFHAAESIFISTGREDSGLFETSLRDERYLPFEGAGAIARWRIEFPGEVAQFDRTTISDVVLHLRYTARDGGVDLRSAAATQFEARAVQPQALLLSARTDFAAQWAQARQSPPKPLTVEIDAWHGPYWMTRPGFDFKVNAVETWDVDAAGVDARPTLRPVVPSARVQADLGPVAPTLVDRLILATLTTTT